MMGSKIFNLKRGGPHGGSVEDFDGIESVYVWLTKAKDSDSLCCYRFVADVHRRHTSSKHVVKISSESGEIKIVKSDAADAIAAEDTRPGSIHERILPELQDSLPQRNYPSTHFMAFGDLLTEDKLES